MAESILNSVKKVLGLNLEDETFDVDVVMHINSALATLNQFGVGPAEGFAIADASATWDEFLGTDLRANNVKTYTYLKVRILFDPPQGSYHLVNSMNAQIDELAWRISVKREGDDYVPPPQPVQLDPEVIIVPVNDAWIGG